MLDEFEKLVEHNPILTPSDDFTFTCPIREESVSWTGRNVLNPTAIVRRDTVYMIFRAQDDYMTSRLGLAYSLDGIQFTVFPEPILYPEQDEFKILEWPGGIEDPRIVETPEGTYLMTYTSYDGQTARLCFATSDNLRNWQKQGLVLKDEKFRDVWSKSGSIVCKQEGQRMVAVKVEGLYWMYYGDTNLFMASSSDLMTWNSLDDAESGHRVSVLHPRKGYFDSRLVEPGPQALLRDQGILLLYNASNSKNYNDPELPVFTYAAGQALFESAKPYKLIDRADTYFIRPDRDFERVGEVNEVCFVEGLVELDQYYYLYYGTADSKIGVARMKKE